ncbi:MAG: S41 family peptidase [bacterium]|nr:S41 family peptidase [bacterium]
MNAPRKFTDLLLYASIALLLFGSGYKVAEWKITKNAITPASFTVFNATGDGLPDEKGENIDFKLFWDTWQKVEEKYVDKEKIDTQTMYYGAIKGLVAAVGDPYTFFLTPEENQQSKDDLGGKFEGIGAQLGLKDNAIIVIAPLKESPAEKAGLKSGDYVTKVDGESTKGWTLVQAVSKIRGAKDTVVTLTVFRTDKELDIPIKRGQIKVPSVELSSETQNGRSVAVITLSQFGETTNTEWDQATQEIATKWKNEEIAGLVIDLRGNPGGYLESAVHIASEFLEKGSTVLTQETTDEWDRVYTVRRAGELLDIPLSVIINEGSASASEILAGALRDHKRATVVGQKSFGKGSVQEALDLSGNAGLHITIAKWILPEGEWINGVGITPDIVVENVPEEGNTITNETDEQLKQAIGAVLK